MCFSVLKGVIPRVGAPLWSILAVLSTGLALEGNASTNPAPIKAQIVSTYGQLPLSFEANHDQTDAQVKFLSRGSGYTLFLAASEAVMVLKEPHPWNAVDTRGPDLGRITSANRIAQRVLRMRLVGANPAAEAVGLHKLPGKTNYFIGSDPADWRMSIPTYAQVIFQGVYAGVDLVYYGKQGQLEYDFAVRPGADPKAITLCFRGAEKLELDTQGDLVLHAASGQIRLRKPSSRQLHYTSAERFEWNQHWSCSSESCE